MKKRWLIVFAALAFGLLLVALISGWFEPRYGGMRANSYVFQELDTPNFGTAVAEVKIKPMGAKLALPALIKALAYEDSVMRLRYGRLHAQLPGALRKILPAPRSIQHLRRNAITVLGVFGLDGAMTPPVRVNSVHPGVIWTPMITGQFGDDPELAEAFAADTPLRTIGRAEYVADAILFLACDDSSYVTGAELTVDGGRGAD